MRITESGIVKLEPSASDTLIQDMGKWCEYTYELLADVQIINPNNYLIVQQFVIYFNDDMSMSLELDDALSVIKDDRFFRFSILSEVSFHCGSAKYKKLRDGLARYINKYAGLCCEKGYYLPSGCVCSVRIRRGKYGGHFQ